MEYSHPIKHSLDLIISPSPKDVEHVDQSLHDDNCIPFDMLFIISNKVVAQKATLFVRTKNLSDSKFGLKRGYENSFDPFDSIFSTEKDLSRGLSEMYKTIKT